MSNYPDNFDASAHDARYAQADCLVDDWHKEWGAVAVAKRGSSLANQGDDDGYRHNVRVLNWMREQAFDNCTCGNCENSNNWSTDGESLINAVMVSA